MATCKNCGKSKWFLSLTKEGICKDCLQVITYQVNRAVQIIEESDKIIDKSKKLETKLSRLSLIEKITKEQLCPLEKKGMLKLNQSTSQILSKVRNERDRLILEVLKDALNKAKTKTELATTTKIKINAYSKVLERIDALKDKVSSPFVIADFEAKVRQLIDQINPEAFIQASKSSQEKWKKSPSHLLLLSKFIKGASIESFNSAVIPVKVK